MAIFFAFISGLGVATAAWCFSDGENLSGFLNLFFAVINMCWALRGVAR